MPPKVVQVVPQQEAPGGFKAATAIKVVVTTIVVTLIAALILELGSSEGSPKSGEAKVRRRPDPNTTTSKGEAKVVASQARTAEDDLAELAAEMQAEQDKKGKTPVAKVPLQGLRYALVILQGIPTEEEEDDSEGEGVSLKEREAKLASILAETINLKTQEKGKEGAASLDEMRRLAAASLSSHLTKEMIPSLDGKPAEDIELAWAKEHPTRGGVIGFLTELSDTIVRRKYITPSPTTEEGEGGEEFSSTLCDCTQGSWTTTLLDLSTAVADVWFHLDKDKQHEQVLKAALETQRPWLINGDAEDSSEEICDQDSVMLCERSRAFLLEELVALDPSNYCYRSQYAATLIFGMQRYAEAIIFLERYQKRMMAMLESSSPKVRQSYQDKYQLLHQWSHPMLLYARAMAEEDPTGTVESDGSDSETGTAMSPQAANDNLCISLLQAVVPQPPAHTQSGAQGESMFNLEQVIGITQGEVKVMARSCDAKVQTAIIKQFPVLG